MKKISPLFTAQIKEYKVPDIADIPEGHFIVQADASFKKGIVGIGVTVKTKNKEYKPRKVSARCVGPVHAELTAIKQGLAHIRRIKKSIRKIIICNDNYSAINFLKGHWNPKKPHIVNIVNDILGLAQEIEAEIGFEYVRCKANKKVDKLALKKRKREEKKKAEQIRLRKERVRGAIRRSKDLKIIERDGKFFAMPKVGGFPPGIEVSLEPLFCACKWWTHNWANKPEKAQKARALPCKHMCALAAYLNIDIYEVFKRQIERVN